MLEEAGLIENEFNHTIEIDFDEESIIELYDKIKEIQSKYKEEYGSAMAQDSEAYQAMDE